MTTERSERKSLDESAGPAQASPRDKARLWGVRLKRLMSQNGVSVRALSESSGLLESRIVAWRCGRNLPLVEMASVVADALGTPSLAEYCVKLRTKRCLLCERSFVDNTRGNPGRRYCTPECTRTGNSRKRKDRREERWLGIHMMLRNRLTDYQDAVDAFCRKCEWDGVCKDAKCDLRDVSPLPLAPVIEVPLYKRRSA